MFNGGQLEGRIVPEVQDDIVINNLIPHFEYRRNRVIFGHLWPSERCLTADKDEFGGSFHHDRAYFKFFKYLLIFDRQF